QWQRDHLNRPGYREKLDFWRTELTDATPVELDTDRPRPRLPTFAGARKRFELGGERAVALRKLCRRADVTASVPLLAALGVMLQRYCGEDDIVVGTLSANRSRSETQDLIGLFVNALPVRIRLAGDPDVATLLSRIRTHMADVLAHQDVPF